MFHGLKICHLLPIIKRIIPIRLSNHHVIPFVCVFSMIIIEISYLVLVMCSVHVYSVNFLYMEHPEMEIVRHLCLELPVKEAYLPRPAGGAVEIDWQLLSPVTMVWVDHGLIMVQNMCAIKITISISVSLLSLLLYIEIRKLTSNLRF